MKNPIYYQKVGGLTFRDAIARLTQSLDTQTFSEFVRYVAGIDEPDDRAEVATELFRVFDRPQGKEWLPQTRNVNAVLRQFFEAGWDPSWRDSCGRTLMHHGASFGTPEKASAACDYLASQGVHPTAESYAGEKPLVYAFESGWTGFSPLHDVFSRPLTEAGRNFALALLQQGESPNALDLRSGNRPLHLLMMTHEGKGHPSYLRDNLADIVLESGGNPNHRNSNGYTALHLASLAPDNVRLCNRLEFHGGDAQAKDGVGRSVGELRALSDLERRVILNHSVREDPRRPVHEEEAQPDVDESRASIGSLDEGVVIEILPETIAPPVLVAPASRPEETPGIHAEEMLSIGELSPPPAPEPPPPAQKPPPAAPGTGQRELF